MSKAPSDATQLRNLKYDFNRLRADFTALHENCNNYRVRAINAEQDAKQWKERFDILLRREDK